MKSLLSKINQKSGINDTTKNIEFIERFYIKKYGSHEKAELVFKQLKENSKNEEAFQLALQEKFKTDFHYKELRLIIKPFIKAKSITSLIENLFSFKASNKSDAVQNNITTISEDFNDLIKPAFEETFIVSNKSENNIINDINQYVTFNIKNTRKELGYPHPRTFNYWLKYFFDSKFDNKINENKSKNSGKLTLFEYIEIVSAFILSYDEEKLNISNPKEILKRFELQQQTQKQALKELTNNNFSKLKEKLEDLHFSETYKTKFGNKPYDITKRKIPYSLVSIIKEHITNEYLK